MTEHGQILGSNSVPEVGQITTGSNGKSYFRRGHSLKKIQENREIAAQCGVGVWAPRVWWKSEQILIVLEPTPNAPKLSVLSYSFRSPQRIVGHDCWGFPRSLSGSLVTKDVQLVSRLTQRFKSRCSEHRILEKQFFCTFHCRSIQILTKDVTYSIQK